MEVTQNLESMKHCPVGVMFAAILANLLIGGNSISSLHAPCSQAQNIKEHQNFQAVNDQYSTPRTSTTFLSLVSSLSTRGTNLQD
jgi:hypothetical protein